MVSPEGVIYFQNKHPLAYTQYMDNYTSVRPEKQSDVDQWRTAAAAALSAEGHELESKTFLECGDPETFYAYAVCSLDPSEYSTPIYHTCHRRYCPDCERRANLARFEKFMPVIEEVCNFGKWSYSLKHIVLTTPYDLKKEDIYEQYPIAWNAVRDTFASVIFEACKKKATPEEKRRGRISLKRLGIGLIVAAEFGECGTKLHFHCLFFGPYISKTALFTHWKRHTLDECQNVHINRVRDAHDGAKEVIMKYATKLSVLPALLVPRLRQVLHGTKRIRSYGIFHGLSCPEEDAYSACPVCGGGLMWIGKHDFESGRWGKEATELVLKLGNNSGEEPVGRDPPLQPELPGLMPVGFQARQYE